MANQINVNNQNPSCTEENVPGGSRIDLRKFIILISFGILILVVGLVGFITKPQHTLFSSKPVNKDSASPKNDKAFYKLPFRDFTIVLEQDGRNVDNSGLGVTGTSFWGLPIQNNDKNAPLYYDVKEDTYYLNQPGGYATLRVVVDSTQLKSRVINNKEKYKEVECEWDLYPMVGNKISAVSVKCTTTIVNPDNLDQQNTDTVRNCYLPIKSNTYDNDTWLAYEQKLKPMGDVDLCELLVRIGLNGISLEYDLENNNPGTTASWKTYNFIDNSITFKYPSDWYVQKEEIFGSRTITEFWYEDTSLFELTVRDNYNQITGKPYSNLKELLGIKYEKSEGVLVDGHPARKIDYQGDGGHVVPYEEVTVFTPDSKAIVSLYYKNSYYTKPLASNILNQILGTFRFLIGNIR